jgi:hypothetical protein
MDTVALAPLIRGQTRTVSNSRVPDPWHSERLDIISNIVHAAIDPTP